MDVVHNTESATECVDDTSSLCSVENSSWYPGKISHVCIITNRNEDGSVSTVELSYIGQECYSIPTILGRIYGNLARRLDLSFNSLRFLNGLELFPMLEELILDNNDLDDSVRFVPLPTLHTLSMNKNRISDIDRLLKQLSNCCPQLKYLSLLGNSACPDQLSNFEKDEGDYLRYRYYVLHYIPELKFLDSRPVKEVERSESRRVGSLMKVVKPKVELICETSQTNGTGENSDYTPLPTSSKREGTHRGSFGKLRQRYTGSQSEGNRFIKDHEL